MNNSLFLGNSLDLIKTIPDQSIDLILTDPPYNLNEYSTGNIKGLHGKKGGKVKDINNDISAWDIPEFKPSDWLEEFKRVLKPTGNLFCFTCYNQIGKYHEVFDPAFDTFQFMVWHKTNPVPKIRRVGFLNSCELIICCWNKGHKWNFTTQKEMHNFIQNPICMGNERLKNPSHPAQKPLKILDHIIKLSTNEGDVVLDPFMGVGSTGVSALKLNRNFIGMEIDDKYFNAAKNRIENL